MKKYGILLSPAEHKALKKKAAEEGGTMQDIARAAVLAAIDATSAPSISTVVPKDEGNNIQMATDLIQVLNRFTQHINEATEALRSQVAMAEARNKGEKYGNRVPDAGTATGRGALEGRLPGEVERLIGDAEKHRQAAISKPGSGTDVGSGVHAKPAPPTVMRKKKANESK